MGFDLGHTIRSLSKLAMRTKRNFNNNQKFEVVQGEFNSLMKKYQGYTQNKNFKVGLNGKTIYIFDKEEKELARFQDAPYMYRGKFIPNTNILVVKSTSGFLLFYDLDKLQFVKKIKFSNIGSQDENFDITYDGKYLYNIEAPNASIRTQVTKYDLKTLKPVITTFYNLDKVFLKYIETDKNNIYLLGFVRNDEGVKDYNFIGLYQEIGNECKIQEVKKINEDLYNKINRYKVCEDYGFTQKELKYQNLERIDELEKITLKNAYDSIVIKGTVNLEEKEFFNWLDKVLSKKLPDNIKAINFNLYEDVDSRWSIELVGTSTFDENNSDWACSEVYTTRDNPYVLEKESDWKTIENLFTSFLRHYLASGKYSTILKAYCGIGIGFVDGDLSIIYKR